MRVGVKKKYMKCGVMKSYTGMCVWSLILIVYEI